MYRNQTAFHPSMDVQSDSYCYIQEDDPSQSEALASSHQISRQEAVYPTHPDLPGNSEMEMPIPWPQQAYYGYQHQQFPVDPLENNVEETEIQQYPALDNFDAIVQGYLNNLSTKKRDKALVDRHRYSVIARVLKDPRNTAISTAQFRFWVKKMFQLVSLEDGTDIVCHDSKPVAMREDIYAILVQAHKQANHGGRDKTSALARRRYSWIPKELIARFVRHCPYCIARRIGSQNQAIGSLPKTGTNETVVARDDTEQPLGGYPYLGVDIKPALGGKNLDLDWAEQPASCYLPSSPSTTSPSSSVSGPSSATNLPSYKTALPTSLRAADTVIQHHVLLSPCIPEPGWTSSVRQHADNNHPSSSTFSMCYSTPNTDASSTANMTTVSSPAYPHFLNGPFPPKETYEPSRSLSADYYYGTVSQAHSKHQQPADHFVDGLCQITSQIQEVHSFESTPLPAHPIPPSLTECQEERHSQSANVSTTNYTDHPSSTSKILDEQCHL